MNSIKNEDFLNQKKDDLRDLAKSLPRKYEVSLTDEFQSQLKKMKSSSDVGLIWLAKACIIKLAHNHKYPGLNSHRFESLDQRYGEKIWESYVENNTPGAYRIFWYFGPTNKTITLILITPHP